MAKKRRWCITYLAVAGAMCLVGCLLYGALGFAGVRMDLLGEGAFGGSPAAAAIIGGVLGGWLLGGITAGIMMFARWIGERKLGLKVVCAVLFMITFIVIVCVGMFGILPMAIYCIVYLARNKPAPVIGGVYRA